MNPRLILLLALVIFSPLVQVMKHAEPTFSARVSIPQSSPLLRDALPMTDFFTQPKFDYLVVITLENKNLNDTYGSCLGNCTYITQLAHTYSLAMNYSGVAHRSLANYLTLTSGRDYAYSPFSNNCDKGGPQVGNCTITGSNIVDGIEESHRTWRAYISGYAGGCHSGFIPFLYYTDVYYNSTRCSNIVNASPGHVGIYGLPTKLLSDLNSVSTAPNFMWFQPDNCAIGYAVCNATRIIAPCATNSTNFGRCVSQSNQYLSEVVPQILDSPIFRTQNAALFITWDEGTAKLTGFKLCPGVGPTYPTCDDTVPAIFAGRYVKPGYVSNVSLSHYSFVKTLELIWNFDLDRSPAPPSTPSSSPTISGLDVIGFLRNYYLAFVVTAVATLTVLLLRLANKKSIGRAESIPSELGSDLRKPGTTRDSQAKGFLKPLSGENESLELQL